MAGNPAKGEDLCQNFRGFDFRGVPYVYINREIQGMSVIAKLGKIRLDLVRLS